MQKSVNIKNRKSKIVNPCSAFPRLVFCLYILFIHIIFPQGILANSPGKKTIAIVPFSPFSSASAETSAKILHEVKETISAKLHYEIFPEVLTEAYYQKIVREKPDITQWDITQVADDFKTGIIIIGEYDFSDNKLMRLSTWVYDAEKKKIYTCETRQKPGGNVLKNIFQDQQK